MKIEIAAGVCLSVVVTTLIIFYGKDARKIVAILMYLLS